VTAARINLVSLVTLGTMRANGVRTLAERAGVSAGV
jgi:hypothetical protein